MKKIMVNRFIRIVSSVLIISVVLYSAGFFCNHGEYGNAEVSMDSFYNEKDYNLDYVAISSSGLMKGLFPVKVWKQYGITGNILGGVGIDSAIYLSMIKEVCRLQNDPLIIIDMDAFAEEKREPQFSTLNYYWMYRMPNNNNKKELFDKYSKTYDDSLEAYAERYINILKFHKNLLSFKSFMVGTKKVMKNSLLNDSNCMKGAYPAGEEKTLSDDLLSQLKVYNTEKDTVKPEKLYCDNLIEILNYCKLNSLNVLFVDMPRAYHNENYEQVSLRSKKVNYCKEEIEKYGYKLIDYASTNNVCNFDGNDFVDSYHLSKSGAIKFSEWFGEYLVNNFTFSEKTEKIKTKWDESTLIAFKEYDL